MFNLKTRGGGYKVLALLTLAAGLSAASVSCSKQGSSVEQDLVRSDRVIFGAGGPAFSAAVGTKASSGITEVTALENFYASAVTGSAGSQVSVWNSITFASDGKTPATYSGDKWWPITDPSYVFYASNLPLNFAAAGTTVSASAASSADKDAVCAYMPNPAYKVKNTLSFEHIFARIGKVTVSAGPDYSISAVSISLTPKVSGIYDLAAGAGKSDGTGWSALVDGSATVLASPASIATGGHVDTANDVYLVPGKYTISATWTATRGNYTETFTGMTQEIDIVGGKVNNISTTLVGKATEVEFGVEIAPWGSNEVEVDFLAEKETPLTFEALTDGTITWTAKKDAVAGKVIEYSRDNGSTWTEMSSTVSPGTSINVTTGEKILFRGNNASYAINTTSYNSFGGTAKCLIYGQLSDLLPESDKETLSEPFTFCRLFGSYKNLRINSTLPLVLPATSLTKSCYGEMFSGCTGLTEAPELPAETLAESCYSYMFGSCTSLTEAPELPATALAENCYKSMFSGCTSLTEAPVLPATTLANSCYSSMFSGCTALRKAPAIFATTLAESCYKSMFYNCTSLMEAPALLATTLANSCYDSMFSHCKSLAEAPALPATTLAYNCYYSMFNSCTSLTEAPELPATALAENCYKSMFSGCTSLTEAPVLPATTLANSCYSSMFMVCTSLSEAPELPATALAQDCYSSMFSGCTSLAEAPVLPATTLAGRCYSSMFSGCTSLTEAPVLPATTLAGGCYGSMFSDCTNLSYIKALFLTVPSTSYTSNWVNNVKSIGTFVKNASATWDVTGVNGIPTGWTVVTE